MPTVSLDTLVLIASAEDTATNAVPHVQVDTLTLTSTAENTYPKINLLAEADVALLRGENHETRLWGNVLIPTVLWSAQVNDPTAGRSILQINFDNGSGTAWAQIQYGMSLWVGTSPGKRDVAELRISGLYTPDAGVTGWVDVRHHSWIVSDGQYISFMFDYPIIQKFPYLDPDDLDVDDDPTWKKDRTIEYTDENLKPLPVTNCGTDRAGWLLGGSCQFEISATDSYAMTEGATIVSYSCSASPTTGAVVVFDVNTGTGTVTFSQTGQWWMAFNSYDSNGKTQRTWRCYWVNDPDPAGSDRPFFEFSQLKLNGDWERGGWNCSFTVHDDATLDDIPDRTRILIWSDNKYGDTERSITLLPFGDVETILGGYLTRDTTNQDLSSGVGLVTFEVNTPQDLLKRFNFSVSLTAVEGTPSDWYEYANWLTVGRAVHHLWKHHSSFMGTCDIIGLDTNPFPRPHVQFQEGNLYTMATNVLRHQGIRMQAVCDMGGRLHVTYDMQLLIDATRPRYQTVFDMTAEDISGNIELRREPINKAAFVKVSGFSWDGSSFKTNEDNERVADVNPVCSSSPGLAPAHAGQDVFIIDHQTIARSGQSHCDQLAGRYYAQQNNEYRTIPLTFHGNYHGVFDVAYPYWYKLSLQAGDTKRGVVWSDKKLACRSVNVQFDTEQGTSIVNAIFEAEMQAIKGEPGFCMDEVPEYGGGWEVEEDLDAPDAIATAGTGASFYYKPSYENLWAERSATGVIDMIQDPFWQSSLGTTASNKAIVYDCGIGFIRKSTDGGQNWTSVTPATAPPNDAVDSPAPTAQGVRYHQLEGSFVYQDELFVLVTWQSISGVWRTWVYYSDDAFATGSWVTVQSYADNLTSWNTDTLVEDVDYPHMSWSESGATHHAIVKLSETKMVVAHTDYDSSPVFLAYLHVIDIQDNGTLSVGTRQGPFNYTGNGYTNEVQTLKIFYWDASTVLILSHDLDYEFSLDLPNGEWQLMARLATVSGQTISYGDQYPVEDEWNPPETEFYPFHWDFKKIPGGDDGIVVYSDWLGSPSYQNNGYARIIRRGSGTTLSFSSSYYTWAIHENPGCDAFSVVAYSSTKAAVFHSTGKDIGNGTYKLYVVPVTLSGLTMSFGTRQYIGGTVIMGVQARALSSTNAVVVHDDSSGLHSVVVSRTVDTYTNEDTQLVSNSSVPFWNFNVHEISATRWAIFFDGLDSDWGVSAAVCSLSGTTQSVGSIITLGGGADEYKVPHGRFASAGRIIIYFEDSDWEYVRAATADLPESYEARGLGISAGKGGGTNVYITLWSGGGLELLELDISTFGELGRWSLGAASEAEVDAGTYFAYPFAGFGDDLWVTVYGRMSDPYSLGDPTYVLESSDAGATAALVEPDGTWSTGGCTAFWMEPDGSMYAVRTDGASSKLYYGNWTGLNLMSSLSFPAGVNPHALKVDPNDLSVYAAADTGQSIMLIQSSPLYTTWTDLTYDHGTSSGVQSLELL